MRLLQYNNNGNLSLSEFFESAIPEYTILSHRWGTEEVALKDLLDDTYCIDKSNNTELAEAINSMFRWYQKAARCYVYLSNVSTKKRKASDSSTDNWFTRGWTLQGLLAPRSVEFFSRECEKLSDKRTLEQQIHEITRIPAAALREYPLSQFDVDERFS
ncbi:hypothetical protein DL98DRAFT_564697 [Cadophora sp. DSE1049]|nr:hypothetical protein DL98DRAFT_564697 [Cadophora sp. DSE1049]